MNATSHLHRVAEDTTTRLLSAKSPDEIRVIHHDHLSALAGSLAQTLYLRVTADPEFTNERINELILLNLQTLTDNVSDSLNSFGFTDVQFEEESREVVGSAFLDRLETLFDAGAVRGTA